MFSRLYLAVLVLVLVIAATTAQQQQRPQQQPRSQQQQTPQQNQLSEDDVRRLQLRRQQGDIDAIPPNLSLLNFTREDIVSFMKNPESVAILTGCFVDPAKCQSASAINIMNQMNALTIAGGTCKTCTTEESNWLKELMYLLVEGYTKLYPDQWQQVFPRVKVLVAAAIKKDSTQ